MSTKYLVNIISIEKEQERWNDLLFGSKYPSYRSSIPYAYSKERNKRKVTTHIFTKNGEDIAGVHYILKKSKFNIIISAEILLGFVFKYEPNQELLQFIIDHFIKFAKINKASYISITPWMPKSVRGETTRLEQVFNKVLIKYEQIIPGRHTYWIDLSRNEDVLLKSMKRQTRYEVRKGLKSNIETTIYSELEETAINKFWEFYVKIGKHKGFNMYSEARFKNELITLLKSKQANLFELKYNNVVVNYSFASNFGIASYMHGAINFDFKELEGCPSPGPLAQWIMITTSKSNGANFYDMGFCPGPEPYKEHPKYDIWRFKYGFGGDHVQFLPTYGKSLKPIRGRIIKYLKYKKL
jgi:lipid II:glycine glycyltransferase (peptidoglycan interpeptide bridge formation enzyme)